MTNAKLASVGMAVLCAVFGVAAVATVATRRVRSCTDRGVEDCPTAVTGSLRTNRPLPAIAPPNGGAAWQCRTSTAAAGGAVYEYTHLGQSMCSTDAYQMT